MGLVDEDWEQGPTYAPQYTGENFLYVIAITGWVCQIFSKSGSLAPIRAETKTAVTTKKPGVAARPSPTKKGEKRLLFWRSCLTMQFPVQFNDRFRPQLGAGRRLKECGIRLVALDVG